jgi:uncharacterized protein YbjT (DUF2867 family)
VAILVTGAAGLIGRAAVAALLRQEVEHVRAVVREPGQVAGLRRLGAKVALLEATDPDGLAAAMDGVFTACSLTGGLWPRPGEDPYAAVVEPARVFLAAAAAAGVRRVVVCSPAAVGTPAPADPPGHPGPQRPVPNQPRSRLGRRGVPRTPPSNPHLAAKAEVERMVTASGLEHAILRCAHVLGPGGRLVELLAGPAPVPVPGDGRQRVAPVWVGDVAAAIAAADDAVELSVTWSLAGPDQVTFDDLVDAVHGAPVAKRHLDGRAAQAAGVPPSGPGPGPLGGLTPTQLEVLAADSLADPGLPAPPGLAATPLSEALAGSAAR